MPFTRSNFRDFFCNFMPLLNTMGIPRKVETEIDAELKRYVGVDEVSR
jgi:hypothetical protein